MARRQRQRTERSRRGLLEAARAVYRDKGYQAVSVAEIVKQAGRAHGTFYLYFDNKQDVYTALLAAFCDQTAAQFESLTLPADPTAALTELVALVSALERDRDLWELLDELAADEESAGRLRSGLLVALSRRLADSVAPDTTDPAGLDPELMAELFALMIFRLARIGALPATPEVTAAHLLALWHRSMYPKALTG